MGPVNFDRINRTALADLQSALRSWLPDARVTNGELVARNPTRADRRAGSFKVNVRSGKWADFATSHRGTDPVSLVAYLCGTNQVEGARRLAAVLGIPSEG